MFIDRDELSPREAEVLRLTSQGLSAKVVARQLDISHKTVEAHLQRVKDKMHARNIVQAVAEAFRKGVLTGLCALSILGAYSGTDNALRTRRGGGVKTARVQRTRREWEWPRLG